MKYRLRSYEVTPPGGYCYDEPGFKRRCLPVIEDIARALSAFRKANGRARSSTAECLADVDAAQCQRLGNDRTFCISCDQAQGEAPAVALAANNPLIAPPCAGCGTVVQ